MGGYPPAYGYGHSSPTKVNRVRQQQQQDAIRQLRRAINASAEETPSHPRSAMPEQLVADAADASLQENVSPETIRFAFQNAIQEVSALSSEQLFAMTSFGNATASSPLSEIQFFVTRRSSIVPNQIVLRDKSVIEVEDAVLFEKIKAARARFDLYASALGALVRNEDASLKAIADSHQRCLQEQSQQLHNVVQQTVQEQIKIALEEPKAVLSRLARELTENSEQFVKQCKDRLIATNDLASLASRAEKMDAIFTEFRAKSTQYNKQLEAVLDVFERFTEPDTAAHQDVDAQNG